MQIGLNPYESYVPKQPNESHSNVSYKSQEFVMGLKVNVRHLGGNSFKNNSLSEVKFGREKDVSEFRTEEPIRLPMVK